MAKPHRLNLRLSDADIRRLHLLVRSTEHETMTEVIREAVKLYSDAHRCEQEGGRVILRDASGEDVTVRVR